MIFVILITFVGLNVNITAHILYLIPQYLSCQVKINPNLYFITNVNKVTFKFVISASALLILQNDKNYYNHKKQIFICILSDLIIKQYLTHTHCLAR